VHDVTDVPGNAAHGLELAQRGAGVAVAWLAMQTGAPAAKQHVDCGNPPLHPLSSGGPTSGMHDCAVEPGSWEQGLSHPFGSNWVKQTGSPVG